MLACQAPPRGGGAQGHLPEKSVQRPLRYLRKKRVALCACPGSRGALTSRHERAELLERRVELALGVRCGPSSASQRVIASP